MKIHIVQRNDTFETIATRYGISVQDLIGTNTHINYTSGLVPGLKVKIPMPPRQEEPMVDQHIQKYYPSIDTGVNYVQAATIEPNLVPPQPATLEAPNAFQVPQPTAPESSNVFQTPQPEASDLVMNQLVSEQVVPVPLKPMPEATSPVNTTVTDMNKNMEKCLFHINSYREKAYEACSDNGYRYQPGSMDESRFFFGGFGGPFGGYGGYYPFPYFSPYGYGWRPYGRYGYGCGWW